MHLLKRILSLALTALLALSLFACAKSPAPAEATAAPAEEATTPSPTPEPTAVPTPSPTPEPVFVDTPLSQELFSHNQVTINVNGIHFSVNYEAIVDLSIANNSSVPVTITQSGLFLNSWAVQGIVENAEAIAPGETRAANIVISWVDDPNAVYMNITQLSSFVCGFVVTNADTGEIIYEPRALSLEIPDAAAVPNPVEGAEKLFEDKNFAVYLQGVDDTLQHVRVILYKQPSAKWKSVTVDPVYAGYTNLVNGTYPLEQGTYLLLALDGSEVFAARNITSLKELNLYVSLNYFDGRLDRPIIVSIPDPKVTETKIDAPDPGPIVYQSKLAYCILRYSGIIQFEGHEAILLDYENVTQNYIKLLDLTAFPISPLINIDGTDYQLDMRCTYSFPNTHGSILLWAKDAPEGTLASAASATVRLNITRIHAGHFDPIQDTGMFTIDLKAE